MRLDTQSWLARLAFSFFILAAVLLWQAYRLRQSSPPGTSDGRLILYVVAAAAAIVLGLMGVRARHRE